MSSRSASVHSAALESPGGSLEDGVNAGQRGSEGPKVSKTSLHSETHKSSEEEDEGNEEETQGTASKGEEDLNRQVNQKDDGSANDESKIAHVQQSKSEAKTKDEPSTKDGKSGDNFPMAPSDSKNSVDTDDMSDEDMEKSTMLFNKELLGEYEDAEGYFDFRNSLLNPFTRDTAGTKRRHVLSPFESIALSCILEQAYMQLEILGSCFPGQITKPDKSAFLTYDERFSQEVEESDLDYMPKLKNFKNPFFVDETQIGTHEERQANKLQKDRAFLQELLRLTKVEIDATRTFETLKENVARESGRRKEEMTLMQREQKAVQAVARMRRKIVEFQEEIKKEENKRLEMINHLKDQLHEAKQQGKQDSRYTRAWYEARNAHNFSELTHRTEIAKLRIKALEVDMTRDKLAHQNIEAWYALVFEEIENKIAGWKNKFDEDMEIIDRKTREQQDVIRAQQSMMESLKNTIAERMVELAPWEEEKQAERMAKANNMRVHNAAKKIQRWWRSYMATHNLYKKKKGKAGRGKSKGKRKRKSS